MKREITKHARGRAAFVTSHLVNHDLTARAMMRSLISMGVACDVSGAGFCDTRGNVHGRSETLDCGPGENDIEILREFFGVRP